MKLFEHATKKTINEFRKELARAHMLVAMMAIVIIILVSLGATQQVTFDAGWSALIVVLLSIVTIISVCMSLVLFRKK